MHMFTASGASRVRSVRSQRDALFAKSVAALFETRGAFQHIVTNGANKVTIWFREEDIRRVAHRYKMLLCSMMVLQTAEQRLIINEVDCWVPLPPVALAVAHITSNPTRMNETRRTQ